MHVPYSNSPVQIKAEVDVLLKAKEELQAAELGLKAAAGPPKDGSGQTDYTQDFFARAAYLAVSGQLNAEAYACALTDVYTFGEQIHRHAMGAACLWMHEQ